MIIIRRLNQHLLSLSTIAVIIAGYTYVNKAFIGLYKMGILAEMVIRKFQTRSSIRL